MCAGCSRSKSRVGHRWSLQGRDVWEELLTYPPGTGSNYPLALGKEGAQWELGGGGAGQSLSSAQGGDLMPLAMAVCAVHRVGALWARCGWAPAL